ncbi:MAG: hypothetical protein ACOYWZ_08950 [Bacillota bacterium]
MSTSNSHITLKSNRLNVEIAYPGTIYSGSRFDWTGFVTKVVLDDSYSYCVPESLISGEGSGGLGFCNEFGITTPIGYDDAKPGDKFPKLGAGLLTRPDESDYFFFDKYVVTPFPVKISTDIDTAVFKIDPLDCNGYAVKMVKKISLSENTLIIDYHLENVGTKYIKTEEYCHNFIAVNNNSIGPGYMLKFPYDIKSDEVPEVMTLKGNTISWNQVPDKDFYCRPDGFSAVQNHFWELVYEPERAGVREFSNFPVHLVAVWGNTHVVSPEVFINVNIAPGEVQEWSRKYEFFRY